MIDYLVICLFLIVMWSFVGFIITCTILRDRANVTNQDLNLSKNFYGWLFIISSTILFGIFYLN